MPLIRLHIERNSVKEKQFLLWISDQDPGPKKIRLNVGNLPRKKGQIVDKMHHF